MPELCTSLKKRHLEWWSYAFKSFVCGKLTCRLTWLHFIVEAMTADHSVGRVPLVTMAMATTL